MAKKPASTTPKPVKALAAAETLNGSNTLPAVVEIAPDQFVALAELVAAAHKRSGMTAAVWNELGEEERDKLLHREVEIAGQSLASATSPAEVTAAMRLAFGADGDQRRGPRVRQEVRYRGQTYAPGEFLPHDIDPEIEDELDEIGAI
jgi:hypothetical protein